MLEKFSTLRKNFSPIILVKGKEKELFYNGEIVQDENGIIVPEGEGFINISYMSKNHLSRLLSNLFPYEILFKNTKANSIEGILQAIKHQEPEIQKLVLKYSGIDAYHTRGSTVIDDWRQRQTLNWKNNIMQRKSEAYQDFLDELYLSAYNNPLYAKALKSTGNKILLHSIGCEDITQTVLTRNEYESRINSLKQF